MINQSQFIQWIFKYDDKILFIIFCMRVAACNQSPHTKESIVKKGLKIIEVHLYKKVSRLQQKQKLDAVGPEFYKMVEKTIRKTLSYPYAPSVLYKLIQSLIELHVKEGNVRGILYYLNQISITADSLLPYGNNPRKIFHQFFEPIEKHGYAFVSEYYRSQINQSSPMIFWMQILSSIILMAVVLMLSKEISLTSGLWISGSTIIINYFSRSIWRLKTFLQEKSFLSEEVLQQSHKISLDLIGLERVPGVPEKKQKKPSGEIDLLPNWHQQTITTIIVNEVKFFTNENNKQKPKKSTGSEKDKTVPAVVEKPTEAPNSLAIKWDDLSPPAIFDPNHSSIVNAYPMYSSRFSYTPLFARLHPALAEIMPKKEFEHFQKIVERGRIIPSKSKGVQGVKAAFLEYKTVFGQTAFSDYKLKIPQHNGRVFGHEAAVARLQNRDYTLIDFDGYDPNAHETIYRKARC